MKTKFTYALTIIIIAAYVLTAQTNKPSEVKAKSCCESAKTTKVDDTKSTHIQKSKSKMECATQEKQKEEECCDKKSQDTKTNSINDCCSGRETSNKTPD